ncbi:MAG: alpha/beta fold hydrolase [Desulfobacterales bacterium]|nr:alpha/beta fold hydrolase [Deltaproteobacteria bacterium]MBT8355196.1 alpha/beta fold hydrolase [Desulfofustis sp.]NNK93672.1 alpha/beta fold hydrolase [Desulfobacterales bacterium]
MGDKNNMARKKKIWFWAGGTIVLLLIAFQVVSHRYAEEEKELRNRLRETIIEKFPEQAEQYSHTIGLFSLSDIGDKADSGGRSKHSTVLIHGLDDPGKVWQTLAPTLVEEGFDIWLMNYPNDQPIAESTQLFLEELKKLRALGITKINIVAHSMGGLVTREMLTNPEMNYGSLAEREKVPKVEKFIMVGTPNHGSQMVRFRIFGEIRDHMDRLVKGQSNSLAFILDGAGEAKIDLLPGSMFLTELNSRPHPEIMEMLVVAGVTTPWSEEDINRWRDSISQMVGPDHLSEINSVSNSLLSMSHGLGDGLVTVESTRLPGIPHVTVNGTHLTMIRNISEDSKRTPPAVPIIVERLKQKI